MNQALLTVAFGDVSFTVRRGTKLTPELIKMTASLALAQIFVWKAAVEMSRRGLKILSCRANDYKR
jgi:predicted cobalt transporter CbtA